MNETTQTQINVDDYNKPQKQTKAVRISKILGKISTLKTLKPTEVSRHHTPQRIQSGKMT